MAGVRLEIKVSFVCLFHVTPHYNGHMQYQIDDFRILNVSTYLLDNHGEGDGGQILNDEETIDRRSKIGDLY